MKKRFYPPSILRRSVHWLTTLVFCFALCLPATTDAQEPVFKAPVADPFGLNSGNFDGAMVKLADLDHDDTLEAIVIHPDNMSQEVQYFENQGSNEAPAFVFEISAPFGIPTVGDNRPFQFVDIDGDSDEDLFFAAVVHYPNLIHMIENTEDASGPDFSSPFQLNPYGISLPESDMDGSLLDGAVPAFADIDNDGDFDLFLGGAFDNGSPSLPDEALFFLENSGTPTDPQFDTIEKNPFGFVLPAGTEYHWEIFEDFDCDGDLDMYLGSPTSGVFYFENTGTPELPDFSGEGEPSFPPAPQGYFNPPAGSFLDVGGDGDLDLISGSQFWGMQYFENITLIGEELQFEQSDAHGLEGEADQIIVTHLLDVNLDGLDDAFVTNVICLGPGCPNGLQSETSLFMNVGEAGAPEFEFETLFEDSQAPFGWPGIPNVDIDGDCDMDIVRGWFFEFEPGDSSNVFNVVFYENKAADNGQPGHFDFTDSPIQVNPWGIELPVSPISGNKLGLIWPSFGDLDSDGDLDMFSGGFFPGEQDEAYYYFENVSNGTLPPQFAPPVINPFGLEFLCCNHYSRLVDIDCDGDLDIFTDHADATGTLVFHQNIGTANRPKFHCAPFQWPNPDFNPVYGAFKDVDADGDLDAFSGGDEVRYFENTTIDLSCDFNLPMASFTWSTNGLGFTFTDASMGNPTDWFWTFGDGETSTEQNPEHTYENAGDFVACLTVSNDSECDTYCEDFFVSNTQDGRLDATLILAPNPMQDELSMTIQSAAALGKFQWQIFDPMGNVVLSRQRMVGMEHSETIDVSHLPAGVYLLKINSKGKSLAQKILKISP